MADSPVDLLSPASTLGGSEKIYGAQTATDVYITPDQIADRTLALPATAELIRDTIGATLVAGSNVTITVDDSPNTITIAASVSGGTGDVVGPASATDNAVARYDTTTGKLVQNSGVIIDDSNNITGVGTLASGNHTVTGTKIVASTSATALTVGANGATNPALTVDASTASSVTGISVKSAASGGGVTIVSTSSAANEQLTINAKGSSQMNLQTNGVTRITLGTNSMTYTPGSRSGTAATEFGFTASAGSTLTASTEAMIVDWNLAATQSHSTGALTLQRDYRIRATSHLFSGASTLTNAATLAVDSAPIASTNATITNSSSIYSPGGAVGAGVTTSYGLNIAANTGGTNNYVARLAGGAVFMEDITAPSATPSGGGFLYVEAGALKYKGSSGTVTTIAVA